MEKSPGTALSSLEKSKPRTGIPAVKMKGSWSEPAPTRLEVGSSSSSLELLSCS